MNYVRDQGLLTGQTRHIQTGPPISPYKPKPRWRSTPPPTELYASSPTSFGFSLTMQIPCMTPLFDVSFSCQLPAISFAHCRLHTLRLTLPRLLHIRPLVLLEVLCIHIPRPAPILPRRLFRLRRQLVMSLLPSRQTRRGLVGRGLERRLRISLPALLDAVLVAPPRQDA